MKKNGFTFVELLVVITIIGVVFAAGVVSYTTISKNSRNARRSADMEAIRQALEMCRSIDGRYPTTADGIYNDVNCPITTSVITITTTPLDPKPCVGYESGRYSYSSATGTIYSLTANCYEGSSGLSPRTLTNP